MASSSKPIMTPPKFSSNLEGKLVVETARKVIEISTALIADSETLLRESERLNEKSQILIQESINRWRK